MRTELSRGVFSVPEGSSLATSIREILAEHSSKSRVLEVRRDAALAEPEALVQGLGESSDSRKRNDAIEALEASGQRSVTALLDALEHQDVDVVMFATNVLGKMRCERASPALIELLHHPEPNVVQSAILSLGRSGARAAVPSLLAILNGEEWLRAAAIYALGQIGDPRAVAPLLLRLAEECDASLALEALGKLATRDAFDGVLRYAVELGPCLTEAVCSLSTMLMRFEVFTWAKKSPVSRRARASPALALHLAELLEGVDSGDAKGDEWTRASAASFICALQLSHLYPQVLAQGADPGLRDHLRSSLVALGGDLTPTLSVAAASEDASVRLLACECLAQEATPALTVLETLAADESAEVRRATVEALDISGAGGAVRLLIRLLEDPDASVRRSSERALGRADAALVCRALDSRELRTPQRKIGALHVEALSTARPRRGLVQDLLRDRDAGVRLAAVYAAAAHGIRKFALQLDGLLRDPDDAVRLSVIEVLAASGDAGVARVLIRHLDASPGLGSGERALCVDALGRLRSVLSEAPCGRYLADESDLVRAAAVKALGQLGSRSAQRLVGAVFRDSSPRVRQAVARALTTEELWEREALEWLAQDPCFEVAEAARGQLASQSGIRTQRPQALGQTRHES